MLDDGRDFQSGIPHQDGMREGHRVPLLVFALVEITLHGAGDIVNTIIQDNIIQIRDLTWNIVRTMLRIFKEYTTHHNTKFLRILRVNDASCALINPLSQFSLDNSEVSIAEKSAG